jgi:hypothetical protein
MPGKWKRGKAGQGKFPEITQIFHIQPASTENPYRKILPG